MSDGDPPMPSSRRSETHASLAGGCPDNSHRVCIVLYSFGNFSYLHLSTLLPMNLRHSIDRSTASWVQQEAASLPYVCSSFVCLTRRAYPVSTPRPSSLFVQFINLVSGSDLAVGEGLKFCTTFVQRAGTFSLDGRRVALIDTPGFDDAQRSDVGVLERIANFLKFM
jgi:hypothetical protein